MALDERTRVGLLQCRHKLEKSINATFLMDHMISDEAITVEEEDEVTGKKTKEEQAAALIELLLQKDDNSFRSFYSALVKEDHINLAHLLQKHLPSAEKKRISQFCVQTILSEGGVPPRPSAFVNRPEEVDFIRKKLYMLQNNPGWVTVFGMAGSGKSVLASEAVRHKELVQECFPEGIHWIYIGRLDKQDLLVKIQTLCFRLEQTLDSQSLHRPSTLDEAKERLRFLIIRKYRRSLLILDDVWDSTVLKAFDIHCQVLLTTRIKSLADSVTGNKHEVQVNTGVDENQALEILSQLSNVEIHKLPEEARSIVKKCNGSPMAVWMIGSLLRENPDRWGYYLRQLERKQFKRIRKSSSYNYEALDQAIAAGIEDLPDNFREYYKELAVLPKDTTFSAKLMSVLWDVDKDDAEDTLQYFVNRTLLLVDTRFRPPRFYLHDLQRDFLVEHNRNQLENLHKKVVRLYQQRHKNGSPTSKDEESLYWIRHLTYHMAKANLTQDLYSLMSSLDWIKKKAQLLSPAHLINDYLEFKDHLDKENSEMCSQFLEFLSLSGHYLEQTPFPDVVQLALSQPHNSEVYRKARLLAQERAKKGKLYFDLISEASVESLSRLVIDPRQGSLNSACFSNDGTKIASCGTTREIKVFKTTSGEKLTEFLAHHDEVLCCAFSPDDSLLATCSSDRKIKVWSTNNMTLLRTFTEEHLEQINHCVFTNRTEPLLLATCSNDQFQNAKLWNLNRETSQNTMFGHFEPVNHCCFSPDDTFVSTCSNDGTVKLFQVKSGNDWKTFEVKSVFTNTDVDEVTVKCSCWTADGRRIICAASNAALIFDVDTTEMLLEIRTSLFSTIQSCHVCPETNLLAIGLSNYYVELWDIEENRKKADCSGHLSWVQRVQFSPDGSQLLSCSDDQTIRLWETAKLQTSSAIFLKRNTDVLFRGDDIIVSAPDLTNRLQMRNGRSGEVLLQSEEKPARIRYTCLSSEASVVAFGQEDGTVQVLEVPSGKPVATLLGHTKTVLHCQFSPDHQTLITSSEDGTIRVWKWRSGDCKVLRGHTEQVRCFSLLSSSPNDSRLLSWSFDGTVKVWDTEHGEKLQDLEAHQGAVLSCHLSPDGRLFATTSADKTAKLWLCESWTCALTLKGHNECVRSCRFSWDSKCLATGDDNGEIRLWNAKDGALVRICSRKEKDSTDSLHGGWVTDLHFSSDNSLLVSAGGYIKWWDVRDGAALQTFHPRGDALRRIHVSSDFCTFVTVDSIGVLYVLRRVPA